MYRAAFPSVPQLEVLDITQCMLVLMLLLHLQMWGAAVCVP